MFKVFLISFFVSCIASANGFDESSVGAISENVNSKSVCIGGALMKGNLETVSSQIEELEVRENELSENESELYATLLKSKEWMEQAVEMNSKLEVVSANVQWPQNLPHINGVVETSTAGSIEIQKIGTNLSHIRFFGPDVCQNLSKAEQAQLPNISREVILEFLNKIDFSGQAQ